jgi:hypothetical protein
MKHLFRKAALLFTLISAYAGAEEWPKLVSADNGSTLYVKPSSGQIELDKNDEAVFTVDAKHISSDAIVLMQLAIRLSDCVYEKGVILTREVGGQQEGSLPFIFGSGTAASIAAETLCKAGLSFIREPSAP